MFLSSDPYRDKVKKSGRKPPSSIVERSGENSPVHESSDEKPPERQVREIQKKQVDLTAGFMYYIGSSLVHMCLLATIFIVVKFPDIERAKKFDLDEKDSILTSVKKYESDNSQMCSTDYPYQLDWEGV